MATPKIVTVVNGSGSLYTPTDDAERFVTEAGLGRHSANINRIGADADGNMFILKYNSQNVARAAGGFTCLKLSNAVHAGGECILPVSGSFQNLVGVWAGAVDASAGTNPYQWVQFWGSMSALLVQAGLAHGADDQDLSSYLIPQDGDHRAAAAAASEEDLSDVYDWRVARNLAAIGAGATSAAVWLGFGAL